MQAKDNREIKYSEAWAMGMLGVDPSANEETIKNAWRMKSREAHPDTLMRLFHSLDLYSSGQFRVQLAYDIDANNQVAIAAAGGIAPLVQLAIDGAPGVKQQAACALGHLAAENADNKVAIAAAGAIEPLVQLATDGTPEAKRNAAGALANLAVHNAENQVAIAAAGAIEPLVQLATDGTPEAKRNAACALGHLAAHQFNNVQLAYEIVRLKKYWLAEKERKKQWWKYEKEDEDDPNNHDMYVCVAKTVVDGEIKWLPPRMDGPPIPENPETSNADLKDYELEQYMTNQLNGERTTVVEFLNAFSEDGKKTFTYRYGMWHATKRIEEASHMVIECRPDELNLIAYAKSKTFTFDKDGNLLSFECTPVEELTTKYLDPNPTSGLFESKAGNRVVLLPLCYAEQQHWNGHEFVTIGYALRLLMTELSLHKQYACAEEYPSRRRMQEAFVRITEEFLANPNPDVLGKRKCRS